MENSPLVTVVIPSYNHEKFIEKAIRSVLVQSYPLVELIVIDDGSRDGSQEIILKLQQEYNSFQFITRENRGLAATLNEGIRLGKGKYICFLASDDYYLSNRIECAVHALENSKENVFATYCDGIIVNDAGKTIRRFSEEYPRPLLGEIYDNLLVKNWIPALGMTYKTEIIRKYMFDERFKIEDYSLYLRMFCKSEGELIYHDEVAFAYRSHASNFSKNSQVMDSQSFLINENFSDLSNYHDFKQKIKKRSLGIYGFFDTKNMTILFLDAVRRLQKRSGKKHSSLSGLINFYFLITSRMIVERLRGVYTFGWDGLKKKIRVAGRVKIKGRKRNFYFGKNVRILGDLKLILEDTFNGIPSVSIGSNVTIEHGSHINSHGGTIDIGSGCHIGVMNVIQGCGGIKIGVGTLLGPGVKLFASNHNAGSGLILRESGECYVGITIGENVWVGADSIILDGAIIEANCVFGAGGVITGLFQEGSTNIAKGLVVKSKAAPTA